MNNIVQRAHDVYTSTVDMTAGDCTEMTPLNVQVYTARVVLAVALGKCRSGH